MDLKQFTDDELQIELAKRFLKPGQIMYKLVETLLELRGNVLCLMPPMRTEDLLRQIQTWGFARPIPKQEWMELIGELTALRAELAYLKTPPTALIGETRAVIGELVGIRQALENNDADEQLKQDMLGVVTMLENLAGVQNEGQ